MVSYIRHKFMLLIVVPAYNCHAHAFCNDKETKTPTNKIFIQINIGLYATLISSSSYLFIYLPSDVISQEKTATSSRSISKALKHAIYDDKNFNDKNVNKF